MSGRNAFNPDTDDRPTHPVVKAEFGEDPARYLALDDLYLAYARIRGIDTLALLKEWQRIEAENWGRSEVMKRLNARKAELDGESIDPTSETTDFRATATDGGTAITSPENSVKQSHTIDTTAGSVITTKTSSGTDPVSDSVDDVHPGAKNLAVGQVLVLEHGDGTEFIFPSTPKNDEPYCCRSFDSEGNERTADPIGLSHSEVRSRRDGEDSVPVGEVDVRAPKLAATKGADSQ